MKLPEVRTEIRDEARKVTFVLLAYRAVTRAEALFAITRFMQKKPKPKVKTGSTVTIITTFGFEDRQDF